MPAGLRRLTNLTSQAQTCCPAFTRSPYLNFRKKMLAGGAAEEGVISYPRVILRLSGKEDPHVGNNTVSGAVRTGMRDRFHGTHLGQLSTGVARLDHVPRHAHRVSGLSNYPCR